MVVEEEGAAWGAGAAEVKDRMANASAGVRRVVMYMSCWVGWMLDYALIVSSKRYGCYEPAHRNLTKIQWSCWNIENDGKEEKAVKSEHSQKVLEKQEQSVCTQIRTKNQSKQ